MICKVLHVFILLSVLVGIALYYKLKHNSTVTTSKQTITVALVSAPESLDPRFTQTADALFASQLIFAPLFIYNNQLELQPLIGKSIVQQDPLTYRVTLREGLYFHNHLPITAEDLAYTFLSLKEKDVQSARAEILTALENITVEDELTVQFVLKKPRASFYEELANTAIISKKVCQHRNKACQKELVGTGPFRFIRSEPSFEKIELGAFENWFQGAPAIQKLHLRVVTHPVTRLLEVIQGKTDLLSGDIDAFNLKTLRNYPHLTLLTCPGLGYNYIAMNTRVGKNKPNPLSFVKVRQAIAHAIDIPTLIQTKLDGYAVQASGLIPPGSWAKSSSLLPPTYDPVLSRQLLKEANQGPIHLTISTGPQRPRQALMLAIADYLKQVGIQVELRILDWPSLYAQIKNGNFDMISAVWIPVVDPGLLEWVFHSKNIPTPRQAGGNRGAYSSPEVDHWLEEADTIQDKTQRKLLYEKIEQKLLEDMPYIPLWFGDRITVINKRIHNYTPSRTGSLLPLATAYVE